MAMTKITFEDLPNTNTPINASNLNAVQDNVETAINSGDSDVISTLQTWIRNNTGLGGTTLPQIYQQNIDNVTGTKFAYLSECTYGNSQALSNGYFVQVVYTSDWILQIYFSATSGSGFKYRRKISGSWGNWVEIDETTTTFTAGAFSNNWSPNGECIGDRDRKSVV